MGIRSAMILAVMALTGACEGVETTGETQRYPVVTDQGEVVGEVDVTRSEDGEVTVDTTLSAGWTLQRLSVFGPDGQLIAEDFDYSLALVIGAGERAELDLSFEVTEEGEGQTRATVATGEADGDEPTSPGYIKGNTGEAGDEGVEAGGESDDGGGVEVVDAAETESGAEAGGATSDEGGVEAGDHGDEDCGVESTGTKAEGEPDEPACVVATDTIFAGQHHDAGVWEVRVEGGVVVVEAVAAEGWTFEAAHLFIGEGELGDNPAPGQFPYAVELAEGQTVITFELPLDELPQVVNFALHTESVSGEQQETGWAFGDYELEGGKWGWWTTVELTCGQ